MTVTKGSIWKDVYGRLFKVTSFLFKENKVWLRSENDAEIIVYEEELLNRGVWRQVPITKVFFSATFARKDEMQRLRDQLPFGYECNSRWLDQEQGNLNVGCPIQDRVGAAKKDIHDVLECDVMLVFVDDPIGIKPTGGGRHVEMGILLGANKVRAQKWQSQLFMIGREDSKVTEENGHENIEGECVFHSLVDATFGGFESWKKAVEEGKL